jgi:alpha-tubulin suppressor-like RCC1 family protein
VQVACGPKHCAALAEDGSVFTWGCGDYGLLGHNEQRSLYKPTKLEGIVAMFITCGGQFSAALGWPAQRYSPAPNSAQLFMWGKVPKGSSSEAWMYPKQEAELAGWEIDSVDCGNSSTVVAAGGTCIAWGGGVMHRELGLGRDAAKTACRPSKVPAMEGVDVAQVCAGVGHTLWLVESDQVTAGFPVWEPTELTLEEHKMAEAERIAKEAAKAAEQPAKKKQKTGAK